MGKRALEVDVGMGGGRDGRGAGAISIQYIYLFRTESSSAPLLPREVVSGDTGGRGGEWWEDRAVVAAITHHVIDREQKGRCSSLVVESEKRNLSDIIL